MLNKIIELGLSRNEAEELIKVSNDIEQDYKKLKEKYPIQYLIGYVNFCGFKILVNENVLIPRFETEFLVDKTLKLIKEKFNKKVKILDLCTGSGAIAISLAKNLDSCVYASDISKEALLVADENSKLNNTDIKFINTNLLDNINEKFDVIISNPPYISLDETIMESVSKYEPSIALYARCNGLYYYKEILNNIKKNLNDKFIIAFEIGCFQGQELTTLAKSLFNTSKIIVEKDLSKKDRYLFIINE